MRIACFKGKPGAKPAYENLFYSHVNEPTFACEKKTHLNMKHIALVRKPELACICENSDVSRKNRHPDMTSRFGLPRCILDSIKHGGVHNSVSVGLPRS